MAKTCWPYTLYSSASPCLHFIIRFIFWMFFSSCWIFDHGWECTNGPKNFKKSSQTKKKTSWNQRNWFHKIIFFKYFDSKIIILWNWFPKEKYDNWWKCLSFLSLVSTIIFPQDFCFSMELINRVGILVHIVQPVNRP